MDARVVRAAEYGTDCPDELRKLLDQVAVNIHGLYVAKSSSDYPQYDPLRLFVVLHIIYYLKQISAVAYIQLIFVVINIYCF